MKTIAGNPYLKIKEETIQIDLLNLHEIISKYETPIMILLEKRIRNNIKLFKKVLKRHFRNFESYYSLKANYLPQVCRVISDMNIGAEVIGLPEFNVAIENGFSPKNMLVGGPYLPDELIYKSIENNVKEIIIYNLNDIPRVNKIAKKFSKIQNICIRINSSKYGTKLGVEFHKSNINFLKQTLEKAKFIKFTTVLSHYSTQMNSPIQFRKNLFKLSENLKNLENNGIHVKNINLGGGFPEAVVMPEKQLDMIFTELKKELEETNISYDKIYFEPGRYFVGDAGLFLAKIINITNDRWIFINIGNHICPKFSKCSLRFYNASRINFAHKYKTSIAGIIPTDQDVLVKDYFFTKKLSYNDIVMITNVGAYCLTFSNRFPYRLPIILMINNNKSKILFDPKQDKDFSLY
ncbi:MAG: hypothetical protein GF317_17800 [Candidatus Lokiarchaeota archaeon]|nr:hypothetical protein [Candidatus Lokiarchaeota archaeon]MBD3201367.1 hypothetical protein [Candidatus Lokiarchaeota archaeon]